MALISNAIKDSTANPNTSQAVTTGRGVIRGSSSPLSEGHVLKGVVSDIHGNQITIQMDDGTRFTGQLADASNYSIGQGAAFQVTGTSAGVIYMQAVTDAYLLGMDDTINQALEEAGLPKSPRNVEIVRSLLNNQQSISKQNIAETIRLCSGFPDNSVNSVITAKNLHLPMTAETITQLEQYTGNNHQLLTKMDSLTQSIGEIMNVISDKAPNASVTIGSRLLQLALEPSDFLENPVTPNNLSAEATSAGLSTEGVVIAGETTTANGEVIASAEATEQSGVEGQATITGEQAADEMLNITTGTENQANATESKSGLFRLFSSRGEQAPDVIFEKNQLGNLLTPEARTTFGEFLSGLPLPEDIKTAFTEGTITNREFLTAIQKLLPSLPSEQASALLANKDFQSLLQTQLMDGWSIAPKAVADPENIDKLYEKLDRQLDTLNKLSNSALSQQSFQELGQTATDMQNNLQFMKMLNESFHYLQLPLKLQQENAHGDLYVMTKKNALKKHPENLSVLLHLEMDHLGMMDIHIKKENTGISTKFHVDDKKTKALLETNIELLKDAINEQGYSFTSEFNMKEKEIDIVKDFIAEDRPIGDMKRYNFDLRA